jgi:predicted MFS family arabinose efflux permease
MRQTVVVLAACAFGYLLSNLFRSINALIAPDLVADIGLDAAALGLLTSGLLIAHGASQLPVGIALDRYGPRRVQAVLLSCAAVGALIFAFGDDALSLTLARALIGVGFAGGLMSGFKAVTLSLPPNRHALGNSVVMASGQLGLLIATWPAEVMVDLVGWRLMFVVLAVVTAGGAALYLVAVPEWPSAAPPRRWRDELAGLRKVFSDPLIWRLAPLAWLGSGTGIAMLTLWAGPWFRDVAGFDRAGVATGLLVNAIAAATGIFLGGWLADRLGRRGVGVLSVMSVLVAVMLLAELPLVLGFERLGVVAWVVFAMTGQATILSYPWLAAHFGTGLSSRAQTGVNFGVFLVAFLVQFMVGAVIDLFAPTSDGGYAPAAYQVSFAVVLVLQLAAFAWFLTAFARFPKRAG